MEDVETTVRERDGPPVPAIVGDARQQFGFRHDHARTSEVILRVGG
jgi:hypothetical protein